MENSLRVLKKWLLGERTTETVISKSKLLVRPFSVSNMHQ